MLDPDDKLFQQCINAWGMPAQIEMVNEEIGEVIEQLGKTLSYVNKFKRGRIDHPALIEEFVDVYLMMQQMRFMNKDLFDEIYDIKVKRIRERLEK